MESNLDLLCAKYGQKIAEKVSTTENYNAKKAVVLITKTLSVLQEQGLYAFVLFCESKKDIDSSAAKEIQILVGEILKELSLIEGKSNLLDELLKEDSLLSKLDELLFAIEIIEKSLIYARFHAKALE